MCYNWYLPRVNQTCDFTPTGSAVVGTEVKLVLLRISMYLVGLKVCPPLVQSPVAPPFCTVLGHFKGVRTVWLDRAFNPS